MKTLMNLNEFQIGLLLAAIVISFVILSAAVTRLLGNGQTEKTTPVFGALTLFIGLAFFVLYNLPVIPNEVYAVSCVIIAMMFLSFTSMWCGYNLIKDDSFDNKGVGYSCR